MTNFAPRFSLFFLFVVCLGVLGVFGLFFFIFLNHQLDNLNVLLEIQSLLASWNSWRQVTALERSEVHVRKQAAFCSSQMQKIPTQGWDEALQRLLFNHIYPGEKKGGGYGNFPGSTVILARPVGQPQQLCKRHTGLCESTGDLPGHCRGKPKCLPTCGYGTWQWCKVKILLLSLNSIKEWK